MQRLRFSGITIKLNPCHKGGIRIIGTIPGERVKLVDEYISTWYQVGEYSCNSPSQVVSMTISVFEQQVAVDGQVGSNDRIWFPRWLRRYALSFPRGLTNQLPVNRDSVVEFSRMLLKNGAPAWQRWQAVRAVE